MSESSSGTEAQVVCTLSNDQKSERRKELRAGFMQRIRRVRELSDGYALGLDATDDDEAEARAFVAFESECCGFASYDVQRDDAESVIWLSVRGPNGTKQLVRQLIPEGIEVAALQPGGSGGDKRLLRGGVAGLGAALIGIVVCGTPMLAIALGTIGLGTAVASVSGWLDLAIAPLLFASFVAIGVAMWRRRSQHSASMAP